jgi:hypothetical protein
MHTHSACSLAGTAIAPQRVITAATTADSA